MDTHNSINTTNNTNAVISIINPIINETPGMRSLVCKLSE